MTTKKQKTPPRRARQAKDVAQGADLAQPSGTGAGGSVKVPTMPQVIERLKNRWAAKPAQAFKIGRLVTTPVEVCETRIAKIVGIEWGPGNGKAKTDCSGWLYWLVECHSVMEDKPFPTPKGGSPWAASESEILKWAKG